MQINLGEPLQLPIVFIEVNLPEKKLFTAFYCSSKQELFGMAINYAQTI